MPGHVSGRPEIASATTPRRRVEAGHRSGRLILRHNIYREPFPESNLSPFVLSCQPSYPWESSQWPKMTCHPKSISRLKIVIPKT